MYVVKKLLTREGVRGADKSKGGNSGKASHGEKVVYLLIEGGDKL